MLEPFVLFEKIRHHGLDVNIAQIEKACRMAMEAHGSQMRESGEPYYYHPLEVAEILVDMHLDTASIITGLLHDTVEDTSLTLDDITREFGEEVARLVDGVTKLTKIEFQPEHIRQAENFRKLLLAMSEDIRVLLVKLADRVHNMRTLYHVKSEEKRRRIAHETMEIYAPLAERIGVQKIKNDLQDIAFAELHPEARNSIVNRLDFLRRQSNMVVERILQHIRGTLEKEHINAIVSGREKTACSIWYKMEKKNVSFEQLSDIIAFRVLVDTIPECYQVLGVMHGHYPVVPDSFKDFISTPKRNGYRSLHTVVIGPEKQRIEIQIRTKEMHEVAELGVAAHWAYKQRVDGTTEGNELRWIRELLSILEHSSESGDFLEDTKLQMYYDQVFCFTPKGRLIALPKNATPVDFAFALHSDIGSTCVGAKVNGRIMPLSTILRNGDQVEVIRSPTQTPSPTWEQFVVTGKAHSEIKQFIRKQQRQEYIQLGRAILNKIIRQHGQEMSNALLDPLLPLFHKKTLDDLLASIGEGTLTKEEIGRGLFPKENQGKKSIADRLQFLRFRKKKSRREDMPIPIKGLIPGMAVHIATCCHPLPGDKIVGIAHVGKGITIHTVDCVMLESFASMPERWMEVSWEKDAALQQQVGRLHVVVSHEIGSIAALTTTVADEGGNITNMRITNRSPDFFDLVLDIEVEGAQHLSNLLTSIRALACVHNAMRQR